ncbi:heavy metal sensor histidine kinase [Pigmentiphaga aceris]|uniref:Sensor protein n=2 Tax=Pigmentiphaga aceris TaxID=1940612 RepID=A0A5C0B6N4_9BURK|nr:heavy metal sensor histidine kinase [Pigmentiphaga aceris]
MSLTARLTALYTLVAVCVLAGMVAIVSTAVNRHFEELDDDTLLDKGQLIQDLLTKSDARVALRGRLDDALQSHPGLYVRIADADGAVWYASPSFRFPDCILNRSAAALSGNIFNWTADGKTYRALHTVATQRDAPDTAMRVWIAVNTVHHTHFTDSLHIALWVYAVLAALLSGGLGWFATRTGLAPLRAMRSRAQSVTAHRLSERMPAESVPVEMADLAASLNDMLARLQNDFQRLSDFSSDLAHELRTPISNLLTQTQVALSQTRDACFYRDILASNAEECQQLARMVSDMLLLAKAEHGLLLPNVERILLDEEVQALFDFYEALAEEKEIRLHRMGSAQLRGDRLMIRRAVSNLLSNALCHTPPQGVVTIRLAVKADTVTLTVANTGPGIDPAVLPRLFDRFFRADPSRPHADREGTGLGLAITRAIVQAHEGTVHVSSWTGETCFVMTFPRPPDESGD